MKKTKKQYFTPAGKVTRTVSFAILIIAAVYLLVSHTIWPSVKVNGLFSYLLLLAYIVWILSEVLCLYGVHWSKRTQRRLYATTAVISTTLLLLILILFGVNCGTIIFLLLVFGNIMEVRLAGKMMKEVQQNEPSIA